MPGGLASDPSGVEGSWRGSLGRRRGGLFRDEEAARSYTPAGLTRMGYVLYEQFRPTVPDG